MDLTAVRMFVAAVQTGSLSAAAARLDMALPTLSRRIRELEAELNVRLFERNARGVRYLFTPTPAVFRNWVEAA